MISVKENRITFEGSAEELLNELANIVNKLYDSIKEGIGRKDAADALQVAFYAGLYGRAKAGRFEMEQQNTEAKQGSDSVLFEFLEKLVKGEL